jgi:DNA repair protein RadC
MRVATAEDAARLLAPYFEGAEVERVVAMHLGEGQALLAVTLEATGAREDVELPVRSIAASALRLGATAVLIAHNHPSGRLEPSDADRQATRDLATVLGAMAIRLTDHLIFAAGECRSLRALGLL